MQKAYNLGMKAIWVLLSTAVGIGFGYATLGILSILGTKQLGWQLWWLEPSVGLAAGLICFMACQKAGDQPSQTHDRGERAIWRLAYRRGWELSLEQILAETMLEESTARATLKDLEQKGQAVPTAPNTWRLQA